jgi:hypothetical protein
MPNTESDNLMILRGKYITAIEEQKKIHADIQAYQPTIETLHNLLSNGELTACHRQDVYESLTAITNISELHSALFSNQAEIDRLKPLTGF